MKMFIAILVLAAQTTFASDLPGTAAKQALLSLTSDQDNHIYSLGVNLNAQGQVLGIYNKDVSTGGLDSSEAPEVSFPLAAVESSKGVVLVTRKNYNALLLSGNLDQAKNTGRFTVHYLANGLTSKYMTCDFMLAKSAGGWAVQNAYNRAIVKAIRILTTMFGISEIEGLCPNS